MTPVRLHTYVNGQSFSYSWAAQLFIAYSYHSLYVLFCFVLFCFVCFVLFCFILFYFILSYLILSYFHDVI